MAADEFGGLFSAFKENTSTATTSTAVITSQSLEDEVQLHYRNHACLIALDPKWLKRVAHVIDHTVYLQNYCHIHSDACYIYS